MKKPLPLRETRGAAELVAKNYKAKYSEYDPLMEIGLMSGSDESHWKIVAKVDNPDKTKNVITQLGPHILTIKESVFPHTHKEHVVVVRKRK